MSQGKLLIVDDEQTMRSTSRIMLEDAGFQIIEAESYDQAINLMDSSIDVALLDVVLKEKSGLDILKYIRHHFPTCPAIMISAHANKENAIAALHEGAADYLEKPVNPPQLIHTIKHWASYRTMQQDNARLQDYMATTEALREREAHFAGVLDITRDAIISVSQDQSIQIFNKGAERAFGYRADEVLGKPLDILLPETATKTHQNHIREFIAGEDTRRPMHGCREVQARRKDGTLFSADATISKLSTEHGITCTAMLRDITERKRTESELLESEARFSQLFERHNDIMLLIDHQSGSIVDANPSAAEFYGYPLKTLRGMNVSQINAQPESLIHPLRQLAIAGEKSEFVLEHRLADGSVRTVEARISTVNHNGKSLFFSIIHDITERKETETELHIAATAFESQESLMITDANGMVLRVNNAFTECTGYTAEEIVGQTPKILKSGRHDAAFYAAMWDSINRTGSWQGEIWDRRKNGDIYPKWLSISAVTGENGNVTHYVGSHIDITERKAAEEEIKNLALYDPLTNLLNRRSLRERLRQALASSRRSTKEGALLFIDLDNFKNLNDTLGHNIGDLLLQQVALRLLSCVRENDTVARLGGDEFVVLLEDLSSQPMEAAAQTEAVGEKILATLSQPYQLASKECRSTPSIGAALFDSSTLEMDELFKHADIAMYQAKKAGRNTMRFFDPEMQREINTRAAIESELHTALEKQQFQLHYQIQVDNYSRPLGAEVLIRWMHPERGLVSPLQFIPLAEETGLILPIGQWVLDTACAQIKRWEQDTRRSNLVLAVNVSAKQFHQADFVAQVQEAMQRHAIKPTRLKLELTESMLHENIEETIAKMNELNEIGIHFSLDDFGTGYSSLQYLKKLPLDQLKIDQSFVRDLATDQSDKAIVGTIIAMAHSMELDAIAEGVETEEQRQLLMSCGCTHYQGYLFGRPVPIEQFEAQLPQS
ncbi:PAS domain S-box-containing protein/diguanylate cyclase (GGDEF) domain-containing protein [Mariprofundus aestuarium]|uniref:PAS domain S-box-containing protein/diguanylate cyclase (GGDEF) domain-containing protein n=1 Tax=Mariprofundus aestuarium TaxID=1921086 RepID=A0A2K8L8B1_MARES|nr:EAL domain-containing protein [Mariprofundus aestuarium]ATX80506.1 PAS domain S-box-containing protein/diguanylate cyclase (GGDEF) domain-containing protein [Mariprofundus aestuarium]